jgi:serine/threonine protein kinase/formylglycine-generating enzyme required for sulfatase activity
LDETYVSCNSKTQSERAIVPDVGKLVEQTRDMGKSVLTMSRYSDLVRQKMKRIDKYELIEEIGAGGMGVVYKAIHPRYDKYVAIKEIRSDLAGNPAVQERFRQEVEMLASLPVHRNIVSVREALVWDGQLYLVMEYIEGGALSDIIAAGPVDPRAGAEILEQILTALVTIHDRGILHMDLKAANILMDRDRIPHLSDFGIAEFSGSPKNPARMASARYAAPELIDPRQGRGGIDRQIDIYASGIVAYEMLLGDSRFRREFDQVYNEDVHGQPSSWLDWHTNSSRVARSLDEIDSKIPAGLAHIVERMMAKDVTERYREATEARADVRSFLGTEADQRNRRVNGPRDDETVPLDRIRRSASRPRATGGRPSERPTKPERPSYKDDDGPPRSGTPSSGVPDGDSGPRSKGASRWGSKWTLLASGVAVLLLIAALTLFLGFMPNPGFTLEVRGAPAGSDLYVDKVRFGLGRADGTIVVPGLRPGSRTVRVGHDGYSEFEDVITGRDGEVKTVFALMKEIKTANEIDYHGSMILIPAGEFIMGDNDHELNERPAHSVTLPDYYIDKFEVTNAQYKKFCDETNRPYPTKLPRYEQYFNDRPDSPVMGITWEDAEAYGEHYGKRLPSEQEWEKAASWDPNTKAKREWPWGNTPDPALANLSGQPAAVGRYPGGASAYGVQDMAGNASEWVGDYYKPYPQNQATDPQYGTTEKVVRGGSFVFKIDNARTTYREHERPDWRAESIGGKINNSTIGFRCAILASDPRLREVLGRHGQ